MRDRARVSERQKQGERKGEREKERERREKGRERERERRELGRERNVGRNRYNTTSLPEIELSSPKLYHTFRYPLKVRGLSWCLNTDNSKILRHRTMTHLWQQGIVHKCI